MKTLLILALTIISLASCTEYTYVSEGGGHVMRGSSTADAHNVGDKVTENNRVYVVIGKEDKSLF